MNWGLALLSVALLYLCFPTYNAAWLAPVALAPLLIAAAREANWRIRLGMGWSAGFLYWFSVCNWLHFTLETHGGMGPVAAWFVFVLFCSAKALQLAVFTLVAGWTLRWRLAVPATAALWVAIEATHAPLGFAWLMLGNAAIGMPLALRLAPVTGVWGISFLFAVTAAVPVAAMLQKRAWPAAWLCIVPALWLLPAIPALSPARQSAVLVQPNIAEDEQFSDALLVRLVTRMGELSLHPQTPPAASPDVIVWPESPAPFYESDRDFMSALARLASASHTHLLVGLIGRGPGQSIRNSATLFSPGGRELGRYDKVNLVPFGEFVPWPLGPIAFKVTKEAGDFQPGAASTLLPLGPHPAGTFICYESVFPRFIAGFVRDGAEVLFNPSNDGWFGKTAARYQHLEIVRMRAVENRRWVVRATNDGISAAIDPAGRVASQLPLFEEASAPLGFSYGRGLTLYTRWGDWFIAACVGLLLAAYLVEWRKRRLAVAKA